MGEMLEVVTAFFEADKWPHSQMEDRPVLRTGFRGDNAEWPCYAQVREDLYRFLFYSVLSLKVPEQKRVAMAEFLTRANYGLHIGNFELDFRDGEIRYKTSIDVEGDELTTSLVKQLVYANVSTMDRYFPGIGKVLYADMAPEDAIISVEGD